MPGFLEGIPHPGHEIFSFLFSAGVMVVEATTCTTGFFAAAKGIANTSSLDLKLGKLQFCTTVWETGNLLNRVHGSFDATFFMIGHSDIGGGRTTAKTKGLFIGLLLIYGSANALSVQYFA